MPIQTITYTKGTKISISSPVYLDANFTIACLFKKHAAYHDASNLLFELFAQSVEIYISTLMMDELWWGLLGEWYFADNRTKITSKKIKKNPGILSKYSPRFKRVTHKMQNWANTTFLPTNVISARDTVRQTLDFLTGQNISPRDSFHLALAILSKSAGFITRDSDFDNIALPVIRLTIYKY